MYYDKATRKESVLNAMGLACSLLGLSVNWVMPSLLMLLHTWHSQSTARRPLAARLVHRIVTLELAVMLNISHTAQSA